MLIEPCADSGGRLKTTSWLLSQATEPQQVTRLGKIYNWRFERKLPVRSSYIKAIYLGSGYLFRQKGRPLHHVAVTSLRWAEQPLKLGKERPDAIRSDAVVDNRSLAPGRYQPFLPQQCQMTRQVGLVQAQCLKHFPDGSLTIDETAQDHQPVAAGERAEEGFRLRSTSFQRRRFEVRFGGFGCG
jgi:hypothetical protein